MYNKKFDDFVKKLSLTFGLTKSQAKKIAIKIITLEENDLIELKKEIITLKKNFVECETCQAIIISNETCPFEDPLRDLDTLCIVPTHSVLENMEYNNFYKGLYFVLNKEAKKNKDINDIKIDKIQNMIDKFSIKEVIIATSPNFDGEITATYISENIQDKVKVTRLGYGLSFGSNLDYANPNTLEYAFKNRKEKKNEE